MRCEGDEATTLTTEVFLSHTNAPLTPTGRLRLARCVVDGGWLPRRAAERFGVSVTTVRKWVARYREHGKDGMVDRSSRPHHSPTRTPRRRERRVIGLRVSRRWGPARIAYHLGMQPSTVHKILSRYGCLRLAFTYPATGAPIRANTRRPRRYEHQAPGGAAGRVHHSDGEVPGRYRGRLRALTRILTVPRRPHRPRRRPASQRHRPQGRRCRR